MPGSGLGKSRIEIQRFIVHSGATFGLEGTLAVTSQWTVRFASTVLFAGIVLAGTAQGKEREAETLPVFYDGRVVQLTFAPGKKDFSIGPWKLAAKAAREKPRDPHPNLYIVAPGKQYTADNAQAYDHNEILSTMFIKPDVHDWDVYWAIVLDPTLQEDFRSESQLIMATQDGFSPGESFQLDDIGGAQFLREFLAIDSLEALEKFRRPDGLLPRLIIVPAGVTIRAAATDPNAPAKSKEGGSSSISAVSPHRKEESKAEVPKEQ